MLVKITDGHINLYRMILNRGLSRNCSDLNPEEVAMLTSEQWRELAYFYHNSYDDLDGFNERTNYILPDFTVVRLITDYLIDTHYRYINLENLL